MLRPPHQVLLSAFDESLRQDASRRANAICCPHLSTALAPGQSPATCTGRLAIDQSTGAISKTPKDKDPSAGADHSLPHTHTHRSTACLALRQVPEQAGEDANPTLLESSTPVLVPQWLRIQWQTNVAGEKKALSASLAAIRTSA